VTAIEQWGAVIWQSMGGAFTGCSNMNLTTSDIPTLSAVTDMNHMFYGDTSFNTNLTTHIFKKQPFSV